MKIAKNIVKTRIDFVREHFGEAGWAKVLQALPPDDQKELKGIIAGVGWFPFEMGARLDAAIVQVLGQGKAEVFEAIGANSARENLQSVHRPFLAPGHPQKFLEKADSIYKYYYDTGHRTYEPVSDREGILVTHDAETFSAVDCLTVIGWYKEALRMCGASTVEMREEECRAKGAPCCRYRVRWTMPG